MARMKILTKKLYKIWLRGHEHSLGQGNLERLERNPNWLPLCKAVFAALPLTAQPECPPALHEALLVMANFLEAEGCGLGAYDLRRSALEWPRPMVRPTP